MIMKVKEKLVQKEGEASMLASVIKQVLLRDTLSDHSYLPFNKTTRSSILYSSYHSFSINKQSLWTDIFQTFLINDFDMTNTTTDIYYQMEVQLTELESIKTKLITERNDVAAVVRRELAKTCLMT